MAEKGAREVREMTQRDGEKEAVGGCPVTGLPAELSPEEADALLRLCGVGARGPRSLEEAAMRKLRVRASGGSGEAPADRYAALVYALRQAATDLGVYEVTLKKIEEGSETVPIHVRVQHAKDSRKRAMDALYVFDSASGEAPAGLTRAFFSETHQCWFLPVAVELLNQLRAGIEPARLRFDDERGLVVSRLPKSAALRDGTGDRLTWGDAQALLAATGPRLAAWSDRIDALCAALRGPSSGEVVATESGEGE